MDKDFIKRVSTSGFPVSGHHEDQILVSENVIPGKPKAVVISVPRSGTHFSSALLKSLGFIYGGLHVSPELEPDIVQDRRSLRLDHNGNLIWKAYKLPLADVFSMIGPGQFVQGHVPFTEEIAAALADFKIIFVKRNLRDVAVSSMRFITNLFAAGIIYPSEIDMTWCALEESPAKMIRYLTLLGEGIQNMISVIGPWERASNAFTLDFDQLTGADKQAAGKGVQELAMFLDIAISPEAALDVITATVGSETQSWTGRLSNWRNIWNDEVEAVFERVMLKNEAKVNHFTVFASANEVTTCSRYDQHRPVSAAVLAWRKENNLIVSKPISPQSEIAESNFFPEILHDCLFSQRGNTPTVLTPSTHPFMLEKVQLNLMSASILMSNAEHDYGHKHLTIPVHIDAGGMVTFNASIQLDRSSRYLMIQVGSEQGFFRSCIDNKELIVSQIESSGNCRSVCTRVERHAGGYGKVSVAGLMGSSNGSYVRIYLCGNGGVLDFTESATLALSSLSLSY